MNAFWKNLRGWNPDHVRDLIRDEDVPNDKPRLTSAIYAEYGREFNIEVRLLRAVTMIESAGQGFLSDGRPVILFERHKFWKALQQRNIDPNEIARYLPAYCGPSWNPKKYPYGSTRSQWDKLANIERWATKYRTQQAESYIKSSLEACSWGLFQLMGGNYLGAKFENIYQFVEAHSTGEPEQLRAILIWMNGNGLLRKLRNKQWISFTTGFNGPGQVAVYAPRLRNAYNRLG